MNKNTKNIITVLIFIILIYFTRDAFAYIKCQGKNFVDSSGTQVFFKGVGLGGWLVPEGYMLHTPGYGSPTDIRNKITDLIGEENTEQFYEIYRQNYVNEKDIKQIGEWGFNSIRLPFNYRLLSPEDQPGVYLEEGFQVIDSLISWCKKYNLYVFLDMHCAPGGQNHLNISDSDGQAKLWTESGNQDRTVEIWRKIAERYVNEKAVVGYDLLNEPVLPAGYNNTHLRSLYMRITDSIRAVDTNHILFIEGNNYATDFESLTPPWDICFNLSYSFHKYWNEPAKATIQYILDIRNQYNVPLWMGESGENSNPWFHETITMLEENNVSWCWWTHKKLETITSPLSAVINEEYQTVLDYWNGTAPKPSEIYAKNALFEMAENLVIERCNFLPDVVSALFDDQFSAVSQPYCEHNIPAVLPCVDYDIGNVNLTYYDNDYQKVRWDEDQPWNTGGKYRNDGVDIELSNDSGGQPYSVGWIESGEWISYTIQSAEDDTYNVVFRIASLGGGGKLLLLLNDQILISTLNIPNTGGWYNWDTLSVNNVQIPAGVHTLKLNFIESGFNINQIEFISATNGKTEPDPVKLKTFNLDQNYPNPFNHDTRIPFTLPFQSLIRIDIFDIQGKLVKNLVNDIFPIGANSVVWNGTDKNDQTVNSGIYYYRLKVGKENKTRAMIFLK